VNKNIGQASMVFQDHIPIGSIGIGYGTKYHVPALDPLSARIYAEHHAGKTGTLASNHHYQGGSAS